MSDKTASQKTESERKQRLGAALRANLKRRKGQAKEKAQEGVGDEAAGEGET